MILACVFPVASLAASLVGQSLVLALALSPQAPADDGGAPTPIEQALIEHACPTMQRAGTARNAYEQCFTAKLISLRADFGRDLSRLSAGARKKIDTACSPASSSLGREAYIACLSGQLASLSAGMARPVLSAAASATLPAPVTTTSAPASETPEAPAPLKFSLVSVSVSVPFAAAGLATIAVVSALVFFGMKTKRVVRHVCRVCNVGLPAGDLCAACRHEAAETVRRAAAERAERLRADEAEQHRQRDQAEEHRHEQRQEEERLRHLEEGRLEEEARRRDEDARQQEEDARRQAEELGRTQAAAGVADDSAFDPYHALGLSPDATGDAVRAAYEEARLKYAPDQVAHLGNDAQEHFAARSRAVARAFEMLTGEVARVDRVIG
jgi:hypothetical protein